MTTEKEYTILKEKARKAHATIKNKKNTELFFILQPEQELIPIVNDDDLYDED